MTRRLTRARTARWRGGWYSFARALRLAELRSAAGRRRDRPGRDAFDQPAAGRQYGGDEVAAAVHQPPRLGRASLFRQHRGLEVSAHFFVRRDGELLAVRQLRRARLACRRLAVARPRRTATTTRSASSSKAWKAARSSRRSTRRCRRCCAALAQRYPIAPHRRPRAHRARAARPTPAPGFDWPLLRAASAGRPRHFPPA